MARSIVVWQIDCRLRDRGWDPQRNKRAAPIVQRFGSLSVRRREDRLPGSQGTGKRSRDRLGYRGWLPPCSDTATGTDPVSGDPGTTGLSAAIKVDRHRHARILKTCHS